MKPLNPEEQGACAELLALTLAAWADPGRMLQGQSLFRV